MAIKMTRDEGKDLTILKVVGLISGEEMSDALEEFYNPEPTAFLLWDMSQADVSQVKTGDLEAFIQKAAKLGVQRKGGRTAVYAPLDVQFGLGRMSQAFSDVKFTPYKLQIFRSRQDALDWLSSDDRS